MRLLPTGRVIGDPAAEADAVQLLQGLARESRADGSRFDPVEKVCQRLYDYGLTEVPSATDDKLVLHSIQNAVIAATLQQTQNSPQISLQPVETGEPPTYYWAGPADVGASLGLPIEQLVDHPDVTSGAMSPPAPMDSMQAEALQANAFDASELPVLQPDTVRPDWIVPLNDAKSAELLQTVFDVIWKRSEVEDYLEEFQLNTNIRGKSWLWFDFDHVNKKVVLREVANIQVYCDPTVRDVSKPHCAYAGLDMVLDAADAAANYPDIGDIIEERAAQRELGGSPYKPVNGDLSETTNFKYERATVTLRIVWLRNQQVPMHRDEAIAAGTVTVQTQQVPGMPDPMTGLASFEEQPTLDADGQPVLLLAATGAPVAETDPSWPLRLGIREMTMVDDILARDRECPHWDIPLVLNVNIPTSEVGPNGWGEPLRMKPVQQAESRTFDAMVRNAQFFAYPIEWLPKSLKAELPAGFAKAGSKPGVRYWIEDEILRNLPQQSLVGMQMPPAMPPGLEDLSLRLGEKFKEISGHTDVSQGIAPSATASGKMVELLQTANSSMTTYKAKRTNRVVKRLAQLILHEIVWGMEVEDIEKIISKYPTHVLDAFHTRWRLLEWNVKAEIQPGNGGQQMQKRQLAMMDKQAGVLSDESFCEDAGRDYHLEQQRITQQLQRQARLMALNGTAPQGEQKGEGEGESKGGGGKSGPRSE